MMNLTPFRVVGSWVRRDRGPSGRPTRPSRDTDRILHTPGNPSPTQETGGVQVSSFGSEAELRLGFAKTAAFMQRQVHYPVNRAETVCMNVTTVTRN